MKSSERKKDLKAKSGDDLQKELMDLLSVQFKLRMQKATQQLTNTAQIRRTRRDIARVRTLIAQTKAGAAGTSVTAARKVSAVTAGKGRAATAGKAGSATAGGKA